MYQIASRGFGFVAEESKKLALDIRMQNEEIFQAMHRI